MSSAHVANLEAASDEHDETQRAPILKVDRRLFLGGASALVLALCLPRSAAAQAGKQGQKQGGLKDFEHGDATPSLFIAIENDGTVRLTCHRSEMGQQVWTAMAQIIADELEAEWSKIVIVQAEGHPRYGDQNTDGSRSVRNNFTRLRLAGAAARLMLQRAAAAQWRVPAGTCTSQQGVVEHAATGRRLTYGQLASAAFEQAVPRQSEIKLKTPTQFRYISKPTPSVTIPQIVKGAGTFGIDVQLPNMVHAVIARPPQVLGRVSAVDDSATLKVAGVLRTVRLPALATPVHFKPLGGVAVIARDTWAAISGRKALNVTWDAGPNADYNSKEFEKALLDEVRKPGQVRRNRGDTPQALAKANQRIVAEYYVPHLAHCAMEPPAASARWTDEHVECWGCVQNPQAARTAVAEFCGVPVDNVTIHTTWLGGGFGRKSKPDHFVEAAWLAREIQAPVKVTWTREDDLTHSYYHTVSAQRLEAGLASDGHCEAFLHRTAFPPIQSTFKAGTTVPPWGDLQQGATDTPFAVENLRLETGEAQAHVRIGWLRSVANIYHAFAVQSFVAEMAHAAGRDAKDYLLELIGPPREIDPNQEGATYENYGSPLKEYPIDTARLAHVVRQSAAMAQWGRALPKGHGLGIAAHRSFTSYVATVIEVKVDAKGALTLVGVWSAMDAGTVVNPNHVASQLEGGTLFGLSNALYGEITATAGAIDQSNFPKWRQMRMNEAPRQMEVHIVESNAPPGGVGEPPTPPAAPALCNAIFAATGLRIRRLPIFDATRRDRLPVDRRADAPVQATEPEQKGH